MTTSGERLANEAAANVLAGFNTFGASTGATTVIIIPAGRTWVGTISVNCSCVEAAAGAVQGQATAIITTAGAGVIPAAATYMRVTAFAGANAVGGLSGTSDSNMATLPMTVVAPVGNAVQLQAASSNSGTQAEVNVSAFGILQ